VVTDHYVKTDKTGRHPLTSKQIPVTARSASEWKGGKSSKSYGWKKGRLASSGQRTTVARGTVGPEEKNRLILIYDFREEKGRGYTEP